MVYSKQLVILFKLTTSYNILTASVISAWGLGNGTTPKLRERRTVTMGVKIGSDEKDEYPCANRYSNP